MKGDKIPTVRALIIVSYTIIVLGVGLSGGVLLKASKDVQSIIMGVSVFGGALLLSLLLRVLANITQLLFDISKVVPQRLGLIDQNIENFRKDAGGGINDINENISNLRKDLGAQNAELAKQTSEFSGSLQKIECDSKDINQNTENIKLFFEHISQRIDLKE